ncbi:MAG TPA: ATPase, T2SS/T4P/T4SS family [Gemmataceae bacterium]|nr:ATPase, T2SS/T4P/T4SS family [Gemmataceae bacterium]
MKDVQATQVHKALRETRVPAGRTRGERRGQARSAPAKPYPVTFLHGGRLMTATLKDVTRAGARLLVQTGYEDLRLEIDAIVELQIQTPWETVSRKGRVTWERPVEQGLEFGVHYVELPADADCVGLLNMDKVKIDPALAFRVPPQLALRRQVLPFALSDGHVHVACCNVLDLAALQAVEKFVATPVRAEAAEPESLKRALDRVYADLQHGPTPGSGAPKSRSIDLRALSILQPDDTVAVSEEMLHAAILRQASDIHIDPDQDGLQIRFRVDGALEVYRRLPLTLQSGVVSRFKVLCGMDIAEKRAPQDGGFKHSFGRTGQKIDIRVATLPTKYGERMTLRLLALQTEQLTLERLGMRDDDLKCFHHYLDQPHGMILLTGPTGSGKTTTLYAAIRRLMERESLNILTVEDPIEYEIKGVAQAEVDSADKVTFVKALRSVLRHDPDVIMVGEIRDTETADVAIKAALTGHLVFSTLHTNSAVSVITRLADMGVDRFLIAATLRLAAAQRLVRQLCPRCRKARPMTVGEAAALQQPDLAGRTVYDAGGCIYCAGRGYAGRVGLFELLPLDEGWSRRIADGAEEAELIQRMRDQKLTTLIQDGVAKVLGGTTTLRETLGAVSIW